MWPRLAAICPKALSSVNRCQHHLTQILRHQNHSNAKAGLNFAHGANITTTWTRWTIVMLRKQDSNQRLMLSTLISRSTAGGWWVASTFHNGRQKRFHIICRRLKKKTHRLYWIHTILQVSLPKNEMPAFQGLESASYARLFCDCLRSPCLGLFGHIFNASSSARETIHIEWQFEHVADMFSGSAGI